MNSRRMPRAALLLGVAWMGMVVFAQPPAAEVPNKAESAATQLVITAGKSTILNSGQTIERVSVASSDVAEAFAVGVREVLVNGKAPGETSLILWQHGGDKLYFDVQVRANIAQQEARLQTLRLEMKKQLPGQDVKLDFENNTVFLSGTVPDLASAQRAEAIASTLGKTINLLYVNVPSTDPQILLNIKFASVDRSVSSDLGLNLVSTGAANTIGSITTGQFPSTSLTQGTSGPAKITLSDALNIFLLRPDLNLAATIKALQTRGLFEVLAEPNVLAINGKIASFLAGGEFPFPTLQGGGAGLGAVTIQFREFGVRLNFIATATPRGTIRLELAPEVSALDYTNGLVLQGVNIPGLTVRRVHTEIELEPGQSFAIGGLLDRRLTETLMKVPGLADVPILGNLFKSRALQRNNTELLIIATPEYVRPLAPGQRPPGLEYPKPLPDAISAGPFRQPGADVTGPIPPVHLRDSLPVEEMLQNLQNQPPSLQGAGNSGLPNTATPFQQNLMPPPAPPATQGSGGAPQKP